MDLNFANNDSVLDNERAGQAGKGKKYGPLASPFIRNKCQILVTSKKEPVLLIVFIKNSFAKVSVNNKSHYLLHQKLILNTTTGKV